MTSLKFRVVLCRIRRSPTLISKMKWSGLPLILFKARSQAKWRLSRLKLFLGNEDRSKSYQSLDVHSRKFNLFPFSSDGSNNNKSSWNNNHTSCWGKDFSNWLTNQRNEKNLKRFAQSTCWNYLFKRIFFINEKIFGRNMKIEWLNLF